MIIPQTCCNKGCNSIAKNVGRKKDGTVRFGPECTACSDSRWNRPYLRNRKSYCENKDGRLGFKCTTTITGPYMLEVDHINGRNIEGADEAWNCQTLCRCCHAEKTHQDFLKRNNYVLN